MTSADPTEIYEDRKRTFEALHEQARARSAAISRGRFIVFLMLLVPVFAYESTGATGRLILIAAALVLMTVFAVLVVAHSKSREREQWLGMRMRICDEGIRRVSRDWIDLPHLGADPEPDHAYAPDLDLFGRASLSVLLGSVGTEPGRALLRQWVLDPSPHARARERQEAVTELAQKHDLRETLSAWGRLIGSPTPTSLASFLEWAGEEDRVSRWLARLAFVLPVTTFALAVAYWSGAVSMGVVAIPVVMALGLNLKYAPSIFRDFDRVSKGEVGLVHYGRLFRPISEATFETSLLKQAQARLGVGGVTASDQLEKLLRLVRMSDSRRNAMFHWVLQLTLMWDVHVARGLERWRAVAGAHVADWVTTLGEVDALGGLAALRFENPNWCYPTLQDSGDVIEATGLIHPYLEASVAVANDVRVGPPGSFMLVTGSNMSGKSTLLRAIGVNVVLARAGGPVAAESMVVPPVRLETSMRIRDSLEEGISFFMAELQRLKSVVDAARSPGAPVLYLLDEILQGTNTAERQIAARTVVRGLLDAGAIGAITTHDLTLAVAPDLATRSDAVHFQETFGKSDDGPTLSFDYRLRDGIATSTNALALMELVGLGTPAEPPADGSPVVSIPGEPPPDPTR